MDAIMIATVILGTAWVVLRMVQAGVRSEVEAFRRVTELEEQRVVIDMLADTAKQAIRDEAMQAMRAMVGQGEMAPTAACPDPPVRS